MNKIKMPYPETILSFAKELGQLCAKHELNDFSGKFSPSFFDETANGWGTFQFTFNQGRHGEASHKVHVMTERRLNVKLDIPAEKAE